MRAALGGLCALAVALAPLPAHPQTGGETLGLTPLPRLPREAFDVFPPATRVRGEPGEISVVQTGCRVGPTDWARRRIVDIAAQEWAAFGFQIEDRTSVDQRAFPPGVLSDSANPALAAPRAATVLLREGTNERSGRVATDIAGYWTATADARQIIAAQNRAWTGAGEAQVNWVAPWSAAFVSWVMCEAGLGDMDQFARDISHRVYIDQAIRARDGDADRAAYAAYDSGEAGITPGDLLCAGRDYRSLADRRPDMGRYASTHCDIVVKVDAAAGRILTIGGNVEDSVTLRILPAVRPQGGELRPMSPADLDRAYSVFAHLKLRAPEIEADALDHTPSVATLNTMTGR